MMASCVNSIQHNGSASTALLCVLVSLHPLPDRWPQRHTKTGGRIGVLARDDTGCGNTPPSAVSASRPAVAERFESERRRLVDVFCVSALWRRDVTDTELRCLTDACTTITSQRPAGSNLSARMRARDSCVSREHTYRPRTMQHADAKVPQADPAVLADAAEAVVAAVAPPRVKGE